MFVKLESEDTSSGPGARTIATNINGARGNFAVGLNLDGAIEATIRQTDGRLKKVASETVLPSQIWRHIIVTTDADHLKIFDGGNCTVSSPYKKLAISQSDTLSFSTSGQSNTGRKENYTDAKLWSGRLDELALFDKGIKQSEVEALHLAANEEMVITH